MTVGLSAYLEVKVSIQSNFDQPATFGICPVSMDIVPDINREINLSFYRVVLLLFMKLLRGVKTLHHTNAMVVLNKPI